MVLGFIIWSIVSVVLLCIGIWAWRSEKAVGFYSGTKPPDVSDVQKYNRSVAILWFGYAIVFELLGLPFLFLDQNSAGFLWTILGVVVLTIALMAIYHRILVKYEAKQNRG